MVQGAISSTLIAFALTFPIQTSSVTSAQPGYQMVYETTKSQSYVVQKGDSLGLIAEAVYGDSEYWTTLWNDNDWIEDPSVIEIGWELKVRADAPNEIEKLKDKLTNKLVSFSDTPIRETSVVTPSASPQLATQSNAGPLNASQIQFLGNCEGGMNPARNSGNGYYGAFQFSYGTWKSMDTAYERADLAPIDVQIDAVQRLLRRSSIYTQFPACAGKMHNIGLI